MTMRLAAAVVVMVVVAAAAMSVEAELSVDYYKKSCPGVENVVRYHVAKALKANRKEGAALVRLIFHDCFVRGCDASVLLDPTAENPHTEKTAPINIGLAAFELIDEIKAAVEERCPGVVSRAADAQRDLPDSTFTISELIRNFRRKNFTIEELVILSGAHAVGVGPCSSLRARLTGPPEQILPGYRSLLAGKCAAGEDPIVPNNVRDEDPAAVAATIPSFLPKLRKFEFLDNSYYHNNLARIVTFNSDWQLLTEKKARGHVHEYADNGTLWDEDFSDALVKLSKLPLPPKAKGEIRRHCRRVNTHHY
ncbi:hypothetical protein OsJ_17020 [Oryza sativa Japonica Group]|uniref:Peroxidase n=1 Tax=Oryza sativa subsp. japonica TaxID=39947 RepID=B9FMB0_ORYSJ|nr:hypothetical protein OsJ_17020 [Oryza sativa Japonica Group]